MTDIPAPEEQCKIIKDIEKGSLTINEKVCPISSSWFDTWKKHVNYDDDIEPFSTIILPIDNSKIISNGHIASNLVENKDFNLIRKESYDLLHKWYSGDPSIELNVISDSKGRPVVATHYFPLKINYIISEKILKVHKYMQISEIHKNARQMFDVPEISNTRLVNYFRSIPTYILKDEKYLENYPIFKNNNKILLDYQKQDSTWYSDELKEARKHQYINTNTNDNNSNSNSIQDNNNIQDINNNNNINSIQDINNINSIYDKYNYNSIYNKNLNNYNYNTNLNDDDDDDNDGCCNPENAGIAGFHNLGNTCYFNSGTQCLMHTVPLMMKFICSDDWMNDINYENKIGMKGELVTSFVQLAKAVWSGRSSTITPSKLKGVIGRFRDTFNGFEQQDSHELIYAMLDGIHEDLNRCKNRPIVDPVEGDGTDDEEKANETWRRYKLTNDSIIVDIFDGLFRSRLFCPNCRSTTIVFDPYRSITIPIEKPHSKIIKVIYVPYDFAEKRKTLSIEFNDSQTSDFNDVASIQISRLIGKSVSVKLAAQICKGIPLQFAFQAICFTKVAVFAFEIPSNSCNDNQQPLFVPCTIQIKPKEKLAPIENIINKMEIPFIVDVSDLPDNFDEGEGKISFEKRVEQRLQILWENDDGKDNSREKERQRKEKENKLKEEAAKSKKESKEKSDDNKKEEEKSEDKLKTEKEEEKSEDKQKEEEKLKTEKEEEKSDDKKKEEEKSEDKLKTEKEEEKSDDKKKEEEKSEDKLKTEKEEEKADNKLKEEKETEGDKDKDKNKEENSHKEYARPNSIESVFWRKMDISPPEGVIFAESSQKLLVTFKTIYSYYRPADRPSNPIKTPSKSSSFFASAIALVHLNENSYFSIRSLFKNIETRTKNDDKSQQQDEEFGTNRLTLSKCFNFFSAADVLDERNQWYCPKCKQFVCAEKKIEIWNVPKILIIQLKRFYGSGYNARKLDNFVDFPEILDMKDYIIGPQKNEAEIKYRLYAVSNQFGSLFGGHYTAEARVRDPREPEKDKGWYDFNDSSVSKSSETSVHSAAAYVLFYERIE